MNVVRRLVSVVMLLLCVAVGTQSAAAAGKTTGLYPELRTVVPQHVQLVNAQQQTIIRFSIGVANVGDGPLQLRPDTPLSAGTTPVNVLQDILDSSGKVVSSTVVSKFVYEDHTKYWEVMDVSLYAIHTGSPIGPIVASSTKMACCFIDWYNLTSNAPTSQRAYFDCNLMQGLSVGWADQYHASTEGQSLDMTGLPAGRYYLTSTANPSHLYLEKDYTNDTAWVSFDLTGDTHGNAQMTLVDHSACETPGLCGANAPNR